MLSWTTSRPIPGGWGGASATSGHLDTATAAMEVADTIHDKFGSSPDLVVAFGSFHHAAAFTDHQAVAPEKPTADLLGGGIEPDELVTDHADHAIDFIRRPKSKRSLTGTGGDLETRQYGPAHRILPGAIPDADHSRNDLQSLDERIRAVPHEPTRLRTTTAVDAGRDEVDHPRVAVGRLHGYSSQLADGYVLEMGAGSVGDFLALVPGLG